MTQRRHRARTEVRSPRVTSGFQIAMAHTVQRFVSTIAELARRAAVAQLKSPLVRQDGQRVVAAWTRVRRSHGGRPRGTGRAKRTTTDLEKLAEQFASFVAASPGLRIEQINRQMGTTTSELALPIRRLIEAGQVKVEGKKRSTKYFSGAER